MTVKLLTEHHLEFISLKGGCTGSSECSLVKMFDCRESHVVAHMHLSCSILFSVLQLKKKEKVAQSFKSFFIEKAPTVSPPKVTFFKILFSYVQKHFTNTYV